MNQERESSLEDVFGQKVEYVLRKLMITKILAQALENIDFNKVPTCEGPLEFLTM